MAIPTKILTEPIPDPMPKGIIGFDCPHTNLMKMECRDVIMPDGTAARQCLRCLGAAGKLSTAPFNWDYLEWPAKPSLWKRLRAWWRGTSAFDERGWDHRGE